MEFGCKHRTGVWVDTHDRRHDNLFVEEIPAYQLQLM